MTHGKKRKMWRENLSVEQLKNDDDFLNSIYNYDKQLEQMENNVLFMSPETKKFTCSEKFLHYISKLYNFYNSLNHEDKNKENFQLPNFITDLITSSNKLSNEVDFYKNFELENQEIQKLPAMLVDKKARIQYIKQIKKNNKKIYNGVKAKGVLKRFPLL